MCLFVLLAQVFSSMSASSLDQYSHQPAVCAREHTNPVCMLEPQRAATCEEKNAQHVFGKPKWDKNLMHFWINGSQPAIFIMGAPSVQQVFQTCSWHWIEMPDLFPSNAQVAQSHCSMSGNTGSVPTPFTLTLDFAYKWNVQVEYACLISLDHTVI